MTNLEKAVFEYENNYVGIIELSKKYNIPKKMIRESLEQKGYFLGKGVSPKSVVNIKNAVDEYIKIQNTGSEPNIWTLAKKYEVSHTSISSNLKRLSINVVRYPKKTQFDEHVFDIIDTEEKAYWLGFFAADGYICKRHHTVGIALASIDKKHVEKFAKFLGCPDNVRFKKNSHTGCYRCDIGNQHLKSTLKSYGFDEDKSHTLKFPSEIIFKDRSLIRHFIRGHFDGDGTILFNKYYRKRTNDYRCVRAMSVVGTKSFLMSLREYLELWESTVRKTGTIYTLATESRAQEVLDYMYKDSTIYLDRKYNLYKNFAPRFVQTVEEKLLNIGESCDANTEITEESKESSASYSVEVEPEISE